VIEPVIAGELAHVPPGGEEETVVVAPWHTLSVPEIAEGVGLTTAVAVDIQPVPNE